MIDYQVGGIVAYHLHDLLQLGKITGYENAYATITDLKDTEQRYPVARFCLVSNSPHDLIEFSSQLQELQAALDSSLVRKQFRTAEEALSWEEYCARADFPDDLTRFAHYFYLRQHPELIIWKKARFRFRTEQEQQEYREGLADADTREALLTELQSWLTELLRQPAETPPLSQALRESLLQELPDYLLGNAQTDLIKAISRVEPELDPESKIRTIRLALGDILKSTDPVLAASGLPVNFPDTLDLSLNEGSFPLAEGVQAFTIDDEDSEDYDDAISVSALPDGFRIGIHISAVALRLKLDSEVYLQANNRVSSLYLAPGVTPLLPEQLSNRELSLSAGSTKACLSFYVDLNREFGMGNSQFRLETVRIKDNLTYHETDRCLRQYPFDILQQFSAALSADRGKPLQNREPKAFYHFLKVTASGVLMRRIDLNSPARILIEELMVLFNRRFAEFAIAHGIPLIFRNINQFSAEGEEPGTAGSQAYISTKAEYHPGIGSNAYVHATSPIRRFTDLVNQYQLTAALQGQLPPFSEAELQALIPSIEARLLRQREVILRSERYWLLQMLGQDHLHTPLAAEVIKYVKNGVLVELSPWHKRVHMQTDSYAPKDTEVQIVITRVFPSEGYAEGDVIC